jgi:hypothetical protein
LIDESPYFVAVHFLRNRKLGLLRGAGEDAAVVADLIGNE